MNSFKLIFDNMNINMIKYNICITMNLPKVPNCFHRKDDLLQKKLE